MAPVEHGNLIFVCLFSRWVWTGQIHAHQFPLSDRPVLQRLPWPISEDQKDCSGM